MGSHQPFIIFNPIEDILYLLNNVGGDTSIEDLLLLVGTLVAFVAFILWCCFPINPKETQSEAAHKNENDEGKYNQLVMQYDLTLT